MASSDLFRAEMYNDSIHQSHSVPMHIDTASEDPFVKTVAGNNHSDMSALLSLDHLNTRQRVLYYMFRGQR